MQLFFYLIIFFLVISILLPWINMLRINVLVRKFEKLLEEKSRNIVPPQVDEPIVSKERLSISQEGCFDNQDHSDESNFKMISFSQDELNQTLPFEERFGARMPVWIGGVALAMAGFYLVRYSIEHQLMTPLMRVSLGLIMGVVLIVSSLALAKLKTIANCLQIAQALSGAGVMILYAVSYACVNLYMLLPSSLGIWTMIFVTILTVWLSLSLGSPIAIMGLVGGLLMPIFLKSESLSTGYIFMYLYFIFCSMLSLCYRQSWWWLKPVTFIGTGFWVIGWLSVYNYYGDEWIISVFMLGIIGAVIVTTYKFKDVRQNCNSRVLYLVDLAILLFSALVIAYMMNRLGLGLWEWCLLGSITLGTFVLAYFDETQYEFAPPMTLALNAILMIVWSYPTKLIFSFTCATMYILTQFATHILLRQSSKPHRWASLMSLTGFALYAIAYYRLDEGGAYPEVAYFWSFLGIAASAFAIIYAFKLIEWLQGSFYKDAVIVMISLASAGFFAFAVFIAIDSESIPLVFVFEIVTVSLFYRFTRIKALHQVNKILLGTYILSMLPQGVILAELLILRIMGSNAWFSPIIALRPWLYLGLPIACFLFVIYSMKDEQIDKLMNRYRQIITLLAACLIYYTIRHCFHASDRVFTAYEGTFEFGVITNVGFLLSLICFKYARHFNVINAATLGKDIFLVMIFRVYYFEIFLYNPWWYQTYVQGWFVFNTITVTYALPVAWYGLMRNEILANLDDHHKHLLKWLMILLPIIWVTFTVRYLFNGQLYLQDDFSHLEIYSYSIAWLLLSVLMLVYGTWMQQILLRRASLYLMLLTVIKVFLFDAAELEGFYRIFSFLGLGLTLLGVSYFYSRFVFNTSGKSSRE